MDSCFTTNRSLLNPKFEGYRLDPIPQEEIVMCYGLEYKPTQATVSGKLFLSYQETQSRITHNHIAVSSEAGLGAYVDSEHRVILIVSDPETNRPSFQVLYELPSYIQSGAVNTRNWEYPSVVFLTPVIMFVSDGHGTMHILQLKESGPAEVVGVFNLSATSAETPFKIHSVHRKSPTTAVAILSSRDSVEQTNESKSRGRSQISNFDVWAIKVDLLSLRPQCEVRLMEILWRRRGQEVPIYTGYEESLKSYVVLGGSSYLPLDHPPGSTTYEPSPHEIAPIPRPNDYLDAAATDSVKPPPYSWNQTHDSITIAFLLPSNTPKSKIKVTFSPRTLTLQIEDTESTFMHVPHYSSIPLWDGIVPSTSFWTWDREADNSFGLLTLHLDKQHDGTRWSQVFASTGAPDASGAGVGDVEVPETLDPSELWIIGERLEKYTSALRDSKSTSGLGSGGDIPSLAEGEMDAEVDESVGRSAFVTWVSEDGYVPSWNSCEIPIQLLSTPMPGMTQSVLTLIIKHHVDGTMYSVITSEGHPKWTHTSTFSALAFVLASKQDTRFTYHIPNYAVFAFEGGTQDRGGNVYIYRAASTETKWAKQAILKVGDGFGGSLLGVGAVNSQGRGITLLCLTEGELVMINNP